MRRVVRSVAGVAGVVAMLVAGHVSGARAQPADVSAADASIVVAAAGGSTANAFVVVKNPTMYDVYVVSATADVAEAIELRTSPDDVAKELTVPAYGSIGMSAEGVHLRLIGLKRALVADESVTLTLKTDGGVSMTVQAAVRVE